MAEVLAKAGAAFTVLDDVHFFSAGLEAKELTGHFTTEFGGRHLSVFPIDHELRYLMPFADPERTIEYLKRFEGRDAALVMADDGEKFGLWPKTHDLVYKRRWLDRMLELIGKNSSWLETAHFSDCLDGSASKGLVYLPATSYHELSQWALPVGPSHSLETLWKGTDDGTRRFLRGGYFRNFFSKYPESNNLYRKMLRVSAQVAAAGGAGSDSLWKAQCNCGYWHGVFGGVYLPHIRKAIFTNLIDAAKAAGAGGQAGGFELKEEDWDADGRPELLAETGNAAFYLAPAKGGGLFEWDYAPRSVNFSAVVSRRPESYHNGGAESIVVSEKAGRLEGDFKKHLFYDWHRRMSLLDHFLRPGTKLAEVKKAAYGELGDFVLAEYGWTAAREPNCLKITLARDGALWEGEKSSPVRVEKDVRLFADGSWSAGYRVTNSGAEKIPAWFAPELVFSFSNASVCHEGEKKEVTSARFDDPVSGGLELEFSRPVLLWAFSLETVSRSEEGIEKTYQGSVILPVLKQELGPGETLEFSLTVRPV
ncbi:MAG: hypothetical protein A3J79_09725 [Elusimicrobia bacterium RIFOXYB2_FULL_62_6]|nr:MAG: hypothetical protein A3J79_09725 [Elusimicrobia bacterium RIFOXYB2_FULL_62_6]